ncbi:hypothetical protein [Halogeometricum luteum]|uniref:Uncharacterized protein n=1 Tax=Halogeometricum luteum TaxID=2950537 RepID=A0ABU2G6W5_9EURY|nr:hypothetical protein [Halogeometricum sp. S3BR5-2]MDS0296535.1 hypothetical protein [Halogeometricum sp. S3BR5-2]
MHIERRSAEAALDIPPPGKHENSRLKSLIEKEYLSLETAIFPFDEIPTSEFARARRAVAGSVVLTPLHADLKAVATWYLQRQGVSNIAYEPCYPGSSRRADVAEISQGFYAEVGQVEDLSRVYEQLGIDVVMRGSSVSSVLRRYPTDEDPTDDVNAILSIPFPVADSYARAWTLDELSVHTFTRGAKVPTTPNRRNPWWGKESI